MEYEACVLRERQGSSQIKLPVKGQQGQGL